MSSSFPIGWHVLSGTLGTDVVVQSSVAFSGGSAVHFPATAGATAAVVSDWVPIDDIAPTGASFIATQHYLCLINVRASRANAGDDVRVYIEFADDDRQNSTYRQIWVGAAGAGQQLPSINTWYTLGNEVSTASGVRYVRWLIERTNALDFDLYVDSVALRAYPPGFIAADSGSTAFPSTWTTHTTWTPDTSYSHQYSESSGNFTLYQPGLYHVHLHATIEDNLSDGQAVACRISWVKTGSGSTRHIYGSTVWVSAAHTYQAGEPTTIAADGIVDIRSRSCQAGSATTPGVVAASFLQLAGSTIDYTDVYFAAIRISDI